MRNCYSLFKAKILFFILVSTFLVIGTHANSQTAEEKKALKIAQTEAALQKAKDNLVKAERKVTIADSLVDVGMQAQIDGKDELKDQERELKMLEREFKANTKALNKRLKTDDEVEFMTAQKELKEVEAKYKADLKANDSKAKSALKKETKGGANYEKGKSQKKPAEEGLIKAQNALEVAQAKYNFATNTEVVRIEKSAKLTEPKENPDKKKKAKEKKKDKEDEEDEE